MNARNTAWAQPGAMAIEAPVHCVSLVQADEVML